MTDQTPGRPLLLHGCSADGHPHDWPGVISALVSVPRTLLSVDSTWIEHRRGSDGQLLGWMEPSGEGFIAVDLLGRQRSEGVDWLAAEEILEEMGIGYLADPYELQLEDGQWQRVRLAQVSTDGIVVKQDDWGANAIDAPQQFHELAFPAPDVLRPILHYGEVPGEPKQECGR